MNVNVRAKEQLRFTKPTYDFSVVTYSGVGEICGKVTVVHESGNQQIGGHEHCGFSLPAGDMIPFIVDSHGKRWIPFRGVWFPIPRIFSVG